MSAPDRPLKILMIAPTSFFGDYGGHIRIYEETLALQALGHRVTIVTYYKGRDVDGLDIRRTAPLPWHTNYEVGSSRHKFAFDLYLAGKAWSVARRLRPDIIHGHMHEGALIGAAVAQIRHTPLLFDFQGSLSAEMVDHGFLRAGGQTHALFHRLERFICRQPDAILTSSLRAHALLTRDFGISAERITPLPDCVDTTRFDPARFTPAEQAAVKAQWGLPPDQPLVVYLGLLADYQGIPHLLQAAARLKQRNTPGHFLIMGYPNVAQYRALAARLDVSDRVTFTGKVHYDLAPLYLSLGDVAISAKMSATEGSGKVLNYMALGLPVVAYDNPVHREFLGDDGVYAPIGDVAALADQCARLFAQPEERRRLGAQLRQRVMQEFDWRCAAQEIAALYRRLLATKGRL